MDGWTGPYINLSRSSRMIQAMADGGGSDGESRKGITHSCHVPFHKAARIACLGLTAVLLLAGLVALVLYLVYCPSKPRFSVAGVTIYDLGVVSPPGTCISASMQVTLVGRNPSRRSSVVLDGLSVQVSYRTQAITPPTRIAEVYLGTKSEVAVSAVVGSHGVPVAAEVASGLARDEEQGGVGLRVVVMGRVKYRSGVFRSPWSGIYVTCDILVALREGSYGQATLLGDPGCHVD